MRINVPFEAYENNHGDWHLGMEFAVFVSAGEEIYKKSNKFNLQKYEPEEQPVTITVIMFLNIIKHQFCAHTVLHSVWR